MRVTVISGMVPPAAAPEGIHAVMLSSHLAKAGCDVTLVTSQAADKGLPEVWRDPAVEFRPVVRDWNWGGLRSLYRELKRARPDAVLLFYVSYSFGRHPMITFLPTLCRRLTPRPRVVVKFTSTPGADPKSFGARVGRKAAAVVAGEQGIEWRYGSLLRDSDAVVAFCDPHLQHVLKTYPAAADRASVVPAPACVRVLADPDGSVRRQARQKLGAADGDFVVSYFGFIYPEKGLETLLEAVAVARGTLPGLRLVVVGGDPEPTSLQRAGADPGYPARLRESPAKLGIADRVTWTGFCDDEAASGYLRGSDVCVLPFTHGVRRNNTTFTVATDHELPVVATRGDTLEPEFVDRGNVLLCRAGDAQGMAKALIEVATNPELRRTLRAGSAEFARGPSSWPAVTAQTIALMRPPPPAGAPAKAAPAVPYAPGVAGHGG